MEQHVKILGILYAVIGGLGVAAALIVFGVFGGVAGVIRAGQHPEAVPLVLLLGGLAMTVILAMSAPSIIAGIGPALLQAVGADTDDHPVGDPPV